MELDERGPGHYLIAYGTLIVAMALAALIGAAWHTGLVNLYRVAAWNTWSFPAFASAVAMVLVVAWLVLGVYFEHILSHASDGTQLRRRVGRLLGAELLLLALSALPLWLLGAHRLV